MKSVAEELQELNQVLLSGDEWLRKQGIISDFSINTIIVWINLNFPKVKNVEIDVDKSNQRLYLRVYLSFWTLLFMTLFRRKDRFLDLVFNWLTEYVPLYETSIELKRWKNQHQLIVDKKPIEKGAEDEIECSVAQALKDKYKPI